MFRGSEKNELTALEKKPAMNKMIAKLLSIGVSAAVLAGCGENEESGSDADSEVNNLTVAKQRRIP